MILVFVVLICVESNCCFELLEECVLLLSPLIKKQLEFNKTPY